MCGVGHPFRWRTGSMILYSHTVSALVLFFAVAPFSYAQEINPDSAPELGQQAERIVQLERQVRQLNSDVTRLTFEDQELERKRQEDSGDVGLVLFLFGVFCALWAQNTGRNAWLWFFMGVLFSIFTVLVLLSKNSSDGRQAAQ